MGSADPFWQPEPVHPASAKEHEARVGLLEAMVAELALLREVLDKLKGKEEFNRMQYAAIQMQVMMLDRLITRWRDGDSFRFDEENLKFVQEKGAKE